MTDRTTRRHRHVPTPSTRDYVARAKAANTPDARIAAALKITRRKLTASYAQDLARGRAWRRGVMIIGLSAQVAAGRVSALFQLERLCREEIAYQEMQP